MMNMKKLLKSKIFWFIIIILGIAGTYFFTRGDAVQNIEFSVAKKGNIVQEVDVTGKIKPAENIDLSFEKSGKVVFVGFKVNDKISAGQIIMRLNDAEMLAQYNQSLASVESAKALALQYQASLDSQGAKLDDIKKGSRPEDITIARTQLENAKQTLSNYYNEVKSKLQYAYNLAGEAVKVKTSAMFNGSKSSGYKLSYSTCDSAAQTSAESYRLSSDTEFDNWLLEINQTDASSQSSLDSAMASAKTHLAVFQTFLEALTTTLTVGCNITNSSLDAYRTNVTTSRSNIVTALDTVLTQQNYISSQKITVQKTEDELNLKLAGSTPEAIASQEAVVKQAEANLKSQDAQIKYAQANVQNLLAQMSKNVMIAPIGGIVTKIDPKAGEIVMANTLLVSIMSEAEFEIEANVAEVDIAKIKTGDAAKVTLDAYGEDVLFPAHVRSQDQAEVIIEGVPTYKVTLQFDQKDEKIKSGMTANVTITTDKRENVIIVPQRAIITQGTEKIVKILTDDDPANQTNAIQEIKVAAGLRGSDGNIEILDGVKVGDKVITFMNSK